MIDLNLDNIDKKYNEILDEVTEFRSSLDLKCQQLKDLKSALVSDIQNEFDRVKAE